LEAEKEKRKQKGRCTIPEMKKEKEKGKRNEKGEDGWVSKRR
jgi:hypothetical protein